MALSARANWRDVKGLGRMPQTPDWRIGSKACGRVSLEISTKATLPSAGSARIAVTSSVPERSGR